MRKFKFTLLVTTCFFLYQSLAAQDIFIKALGKRGDDNTIFKGGSVVKGHENEIEASSFSQTDTSCGLITTGGGAGGCRTATGPWVFGMPMNSSVIDFKEYMYSSKKIGIVTVNLVKPGQIPFTYYTVVMTNVFVKMVSESGGHGGIPQFYIELDPSTIKWIYTDQNNDGSPGKKTSFGWDRKNNVPL